jgi:Right handed beta helix region
MLRRLAFSAAAGLAALGAAAPLSHAAGAYYVDRDALGGSCSDARSATVASSPSSPWCSIARAIAAAPSGSTVLVRAGSYPKISLTGNNARTDYVTFKPMAGEAVSIAGATINTSRFLRFEGFRFSASVVLNHDANQMAFVNNDLPGGRFMITGTADTLVEGNHVHDLPPNMTTCSCGIRAVKDFGRGIPVTGLVIRDNRVERLSNDVIQLNKAPGALVEGNYGADAYPAGYGEHTDALQIIMSDDVVVRRNAWHRIQQGVTFSDGTSRSTTFENNIITDTNGYAFKTGYADENPGIRVINNTFRRAGYTAVQFRGAHPNATVINNIWDGASGGLGAGSRMEANLDESEVTFAPGADELAAASAAVDAGSANGAPLVDEADRLRDAAPDIGALEYQGLSPLAPQEPSPVSEPAPDPVSTPSADELRVSANADRSADQDLEGAMVTGNAYVFLDDSPPKTGPVTFYLDGVLQRTEKNAPWDLAGGSATTATAFDFGVLSPGRHILRAVWAGGEDSSTFTR